MLVVLDGSHKWSHKADRSILSFHSPDMEALQRHVEELGFACKPVTMDLKRGQFSLHHCRVIHGSYPNRSDRPRIALCRCGSSSTKPFCDGTHAKIGFAAPEQAPQNA